MRVVLALVLAVLMLAFGGSTALAQDGGGAFDPLPPPTRAETPAPEAPPSVEAQQETDRTLLLGIGAALLVLFVVIARFITRDARQTLGPDAGPAAPALRGAGPHRHAKQTKTKARAKAKAQRAARRQNR
jgi:hypothetical protein